jgi:hypothetical protein
MTHCARCLIPCSLREAGATSNVGVPIDVATPGISVEWYVDRELISGASLMNIIATTVLCLSGAEDTYMESSVHNDIGDGRISAMP